MKYSHSELLLRFRGNPSYKRFIEDMRKANIDVCIQVLPGNKETPVAVATTNAAYSDIVNSAGVLIHSELIGTRVVVSPLL
jgi:hypothetical protein